MLNHAYTLLLNENPASLVQDVRLVDPDFSRIQLPRALWPFNQALYADCATAAMREQRAESWLSMLTSPELLPYTLKFDSRNTYGGRVSTLLTMCSTDASLALADDRLEAVATAVKLCTGLFTLPEHKDDMLLFHKMFYSAPDRYTALAGALLAYTYQLEALRIK